MEIPIYFGRVGYYGIENKTLYADYMNENGTTHREKISQELFDKLKALNIKPHSVVVGLFDVNAFNSLTLYDINL